MAMEIPVYLFTGFLEAGKTRFIQETLEDARFNAGERTLLLLCEEGEEEYAPDTFAGSNVFIETIEAESGLAATRLAALQKKHRATRVLVEYNGMWMLDSLYQHMPEEWSIYQEFLFVDARTFLAYNANMRSLVVDKLKSCELVVFNRTSEETDQLMFHKIVRATSRRANIAFEYPNGKVEYDEIEDPLPFDLNAPIVEIADGDYALWYQDATEDAGKYAGKTVRFKGTVALSPKLGKDVFIVGRHVMTCCVNDIKYAALVCKWPEAAPLHKRDWVLLTAKISVEYHKAYGTKGPVLTAIAVEHAEKPEEEVATFY